ncbi:MAG: fused MFS/spermidine synthase [Deltaproteobacteria bacterium]|nr:fused MFS/spermidine synthase [Deltaproteobacteria bacterium]
MIRTASNGIRPPVSRGTLTLVTGLFFLSGSAGLVYQVLWMRQLGLFFGSDMYGVSIILSTFMGGLALGSLLGGRLAEQTSRPLLWYGVAELGIGLFALPFSTILAGFDPLLQAAYPQGSGGATATYQAARVLLASGTLLVPTTLMGMTLPLIMKHFVRSRSAVGELAAYFYAVNTFGALIGTLTAGFALLPYLGMTRSTWCAATINLVIGAISVVIGSRAALPADDPERLARADVDPLPDMEAGARRRIAAVVLLAFGVSGFCSFALEVVWTRILLISFSATVYSFASTLACFLFGIFLGSRLIARSVDEHENPVGLFAALELSIGVSVGALCLLIYAVPGIFGRLLTGVATLLDRGEATLVVSTLVASFLLLVIPATLLGATFPVALRLYTTNIARVGSRTGRLYAANTVGAIFGSLAAGMILLPSLGATASLAIIATLFFGVGAALASLGVGTGEPALPLRRVGMAGVATLLPVVISLALPYRVTLNFNQQNLEGSELVYHAEGVQNTIDVMRSPSGATALVIGGNVEADNSYRQRRHFVLKGHLPLLFLAEPKSVLVVGLGMGITLQATARHPGLERIDVVELSPEILEAQSQLGETNGHVIENPLVHVRIDDGRLFMKLSSNRYDMITADPIHPKISRVGYLYTAEYYRSIRDRLTEGGVVCQWMPTYQISPLRFRSAVKTFVEVFPEATLWYVESHALLVAKTDSSSIDFRLLEQKFRNPSIREDLASIDIHSPAELLSHLLMGPEELRAYLHDTPEVPINTDDHPYLEYFVPRDLFATTPDNAREFAEHLADPAHLVRNLPPDAATSLRELSRERSRRLLAR